MTTNFVFFMIAYIISYALHSLITKSTSDIKTIVWIFGSSILWHDRMGKKKFQFVLSIRMSLGLKCNGFELPINFSFWLANWTNFCNVGLSILVCCWPIVFYAQKNYILIYMNDCKASSAEFILIYFIETKYISNIWKILEILVV
jgi:hypothetical protein